MRHPFRCEAAGKPSNGWHDALGIFVLRSLRPIAPSVGRLLNSLSKSHYGSQRMTMSKKLYVGNLSFETTSDDLRQAFESYGTVTSASVISDRATGRSRGFGFVEMSHGADAAIEGLNLADLQGRRVTVNEARQREERGGGGRRGGGGGGFRRSY